MWLKLGMCDLLIEDVIAVTETLMVADVVDIEAYAHPDAKLSLNYKICMASLGLEENARVSWKQKVDELRSKMAERRDGDGVFKRGSC
jgi:hypothetical protein